MGTGPPLFLRRVASGRCATGRVMIEESPQRRTRAAMMVGFRGRAADANVTAALTVCHERWLVGFDELVKIYETHVAGNVRPPDQWLSLMAAFVQNGVVPQSAIETLSSRLGDALVPAPAPANATGGVAPPPPPPSAAASGSAAGTAPLRSVHEALKHGRSSTSRSMVKCCTVYVGSTSFFFVSELGFSRIFSWKLIHTVGHTAQQRQDRRSVGLGGVACV